MSATARIIQFPERRERLVTLRELMEVFGYSERFWRYRIAEGLPKHKWGSRIRFDVAEVQRWMEERYEHA